jgi:hypothetical protein
MKIANVIVILVKMGIAQIAHVMIAPAQIALAKSY